MQFELAKLQPIERYKLLSSTVIPRPIAWVTTIGPSGALNAAPFSFFNVFSEDPPTVGFAINDRTPGDNKDTGRNVQAHPEFVVNLVDLPRLDQMNITATEFDPSVDEFRQAGLTPAPSVSAKPPRIAESPVSFECKLSQLVDLGRHRVLVLGEVQVMHVRDDAVKDAARYHIDTAALDLVGRMQGNSYVKTRDVMEVPRVTVDGWTLR